jgi:DNA-binding transcriptional ArsR family regulator
MSTATVLEALADALDAASAVLRERLAVLNLASPSPSPAASSLTAVERARAIHPQLGPRQAQVLQCLDDAGASGATAGTISRTIDYDQPNVHITLQALVKMGFVEKDESARPHRYRLAPRLEQRGKE